MKHIAAYLLLLVGGNAAPTADDIKKVLSAGGVEADDEALTRLMTAVDGKVRAILFLSFLQWIFSVLAPRERLRLFGVHAHLRPRKAKRCCHYSASFCALLHIILPLNLFAVR